MYWIDVVTPLLEECDDDTCTPEMGTWESSGTSKTSEFDCRGQNTLPWGVIHVIEKLLNCRCRKWPCMSHLDIRSTSYGKKKGRKPNCSQFVSRPLKVKNRPDPSVCRWNATHRWKALKLQVCFRPHPNPKSKQKVMNSQNLGTPNWDSFGTLPWDSWDKKPFRCGCRGVTQRILYGGRWRFPPSPGRGESCESKVAYGLSQHQGCSKCELINLLVGLM
jgi:hypothetical protein